MQQVKTRKWISSYAILQKIKIRNATSTTNRRVRFPLSYFIAASTLHSKRSPSYLNARTANGNRKLCKTIAPPRVGHASMNTGWKFGKILPKPDAEFREKRMNRKNRPSNSLPLPWSTTRHDELPTDPKSTFSLQSVGHETTRQLWTTVNSIYVAGYIRVLSLPALSRPGD